MTATAVSILIVDDNAAVRELLEWHLSSEYQCTSAAHAEQALELLAQRHFSLVITDVEMPGADGFALCRTVKQRWPDSAVLIVSGQNDCQHCSEAQRVGAFAFLPKPIDLVWLARSIKFALIKGNK